MSPNYLSYVLSFDLDLVVIKNYCITTLKLESAKMLKDKSTRTLYCFIATEVKKYLKNTNSSFFKRNSFTLYV